MTSAQGKSAAQSAGRPRDPAAVNAVVAALAAQFGNRLVTSQAVREQHANTTTWIENEAPDAVVFPQTTADVQAIVRICAAHRVPVIPFGTGTSLEGHINAPLGGVSVDFRDMNRVLAVNAQDLDCVVEPGITRKQLNEHLRDQGLFFPLDPGADASLGGMAATRCSGTNAVRYGTMKDNVLGLKVVLANGELMTTARRAKKSSAGYDLTRLMVGSEGTLGVITELTLKLTGIPEAISGGVCPFPSVEAACNAAIATIQSGIPVARIELLDELQVKATNLYSKLTLPEVPMLFVEFHGSPAGVAEQSERFGEIAAHGLVAPIMGHVGDGNFHLTLLVDMADAAEVKAAKALCERLVERALAMDGTCTGEHGVGQGKMKYLAGELGEPALAAMAAIKRALDPEGIM
ncbi:MAG TPA: FAD-linked oxidase C-terminal domain-containing protein, partial [Xanthobacteraceae bacterium]|nr:FAD-linked oxidase C-terminal domain-containing protein [Xanthobacteraceae bacterium]